MEYTRSSSAWGKYPVYDLTMRLRDPEEWKKLSISAHDGFAKIAAETSQLGTLPNDDFKNIGMIPLPTADIEYAAQFSARNGSWSQTLILRHTRQMAGSLPLLCARAGKWRNPTQNYATNQCCVISLIPAFRKKNLTN